MGMSPDQFAEIFNVIELDISPSRAPRWVSTRGCPAERLALTLRFLATGESFRSHHFKFRISRLAISYFVTEVCEALWLFINNHDVLLFLVFVANDARNKMAIHDWLAERT